MLLLIRFSRVRLCATPRTAVHQASPSMGTTIKLSNFTPGYKSKRKKNMNSKRYLHPNVLSSLIYNCQDREAS